MATAEQVLVVPTDELMSLIPSSGSGFRPGGIERVKDIVRAAGVFLERNPVETNTAWKQIIPYGLVTCLNRIFLMRRLPKGGEQRLHGKLSIGVGGHINPRDAAGHADVAGSLEIAFAREIAEELEIKTASTIRPLGLLNDDSNAVGRVHFGVVYAVDVLTPDVEVRETDALEGEFVDLDELNRRAESLETWSRLLVADAALSLLQ